MYGGNEIFSRDYQQNGTDRDRMGRIVNVTEQVYDGSGNLEEHLWSYRYDGLGHLREVDETTGGMTSNRSYTYDANGNRTHENGVEVAVFDRQDRLICRQQGGDFVHYEYTASGSLWLKQEGCTDLSCASCSGRETRYAYDALGNLLRVEASDGNVVEYVIDGQGRRIGRRVNGEDDTARGWLYKDGLNPVAELDKNGDVRATFVYGAKANVPEYMVFNDHKYRLLTDQLGSVRLVVKVSSGNIVQRMDYDEWGNVTLDTNPNFQPFGFAGGIYDAETGLVRFGARDYDPEIGRWTAKDPILFEGGQANLYVYVGNDPINRIDPSGLVDWEDAGIAFAGIIGNGMGLAGAFLMVPTTGGLGTFAAVLIVAKTSYGLMANTQNLIRAFMEEDQTSTGALYNDIARAVAPGNEAAQSIATSADLATDLACMRINHPRKLPDIYTKSGIRLERYLLNSSPWNPQVESLLTTMFGTDVMRAIYDAYKE